MNNLKTIGALSCLWLSSAVAQPAPALTLTRLDCGNEPEPMRLAGFSDTYANPDLKLPLTYSCYLIRHGDDYMVWDAGNGLGAGAESPKASIVELLGRLQIKPEQVKYPAPATSSRCRKTRRTFSVMEPSSCSACRVTRRVITLYC